MIKLKTKSYFQLKALHFANGDQQRGENGPVTCIAFSYFFTLKIHVLSILAEFMDDWRTNK